MAFDILSSNRVEMLQAALARRLAEDPLADPFEAETIVVPTYAMARWLNLRLAQAHGVAAHIAYPRSGEWLWQTARLVIDDLPAQDPYSREAMCWQIFDQLPALLEKPAFAELGRYLHPGGDDVKRWQLAWRIADSFDRYQVFRPQLVRAWSRGDDDHWQAILWRSLIARGRMPDRVSAIGRLISALERGQATDALPRRVSLFALNSMAPLHLEVAAALARRIDVQLYLHSPTDQYWADLESERQKSKRRLQAPGFEELYDSGNELLAAWGRQGQVFQDLLLQGAGDIVIDTDLFVAPGDDSLLGRVQYSIFAVAPEPIPARADDSVVVHRCHSPLRECQVLLDEVLAMLERDPRLEPEDILVMIPDIATYAPYIEAVFQGQRVAYTISDTTLADTHPLVNTFLRLLDLPQSRFTSNEVLAFLDNPALCRRFGIGSDDVEEIERLVRLAHTRWGIDAGHKAEFDLPPTGGNTWQQARERFLAGFAFADTPLWEGIAPISGWDENEAGAIGRFWYFFDRLCAWRKRLRQTRGALAWQALLLQLLEEFFAETDPRDSPVQQVRDAIAGLEPVADAVLSPELIRYLMRSLLAAHEHSGQLYSGGITFCGMRPMRSIPFKVICLLGMNYDDFPRRDAVSDFELISRQRVAGDPSKRNEDRYLMLETLLCARQKLYLSYTGRNLKDNAERPPSALVQELLDFIGGDGATESADPATGDSLVRDHPMQAFSGACFEPGRGSFSQYWCAVANRLAQVSAPRLEAWPRAKLPDANTVESIDLVQLGQFLRHPVQYFFRQRLGLFLDAEDLPEDDEIFELAGLERWRLGNELARDLLLQGDASGERVLASALLAHGPAGRAQLDEIRREQASWFEHLQAYAQAERAALPINLALGDSTELRGALSSYFPGRGLMRYHAGSVRSSRLLTLWLDHLALHASEQARPGEQSLLIGTDARFAFTPLEPADARHRLADYCNLYREGQRQPLPVLPESSFIWASEPDRDRALGKLRQKWHDPWSGRYFRDRTDAYLDLVLRRLERPPLGEPDFDRYARRLYAGLLDQVRES